MGKHVLELVEGQQQQVSCAVVCHPPAIHLKGMSCWRFPHLSSTALTVSYLLWVAIETGMMGILSPCPWQWVKTPRDLHCLHFLSSSTNMPRASMFLTEDAIPQLDCFLVLLKACTISSPLPYKPMKRKRVLVIWPDPLSAHRFSSV